LTSAAGPRHGAGEVFAVFLRLGLTSFGGPVAHLAYFRDEFVARRRWLGERAYADLVALCQFLPGPASSQVGFALGLSRAGLPGALAAWAGFTLPSALALIVLALGLAQAGDALPAGVLHGLKLAAVAVVAQAVWGMARALCVGPVRATLMVAAAGVVLWVPGVAVQFGVLAVAAGIGWWRLRLPPVVGTAADTAAASPSPVVARTGFVTTSSSSPAAVRPGPVDASSSSAAAATGLDDLRVPVSHRAAAVCLALSLGLLVALPLLAAALPHPALAQFDAFYRAGALVFGGGHVVLPLLEAEVVGSAWVREDVFLAGYGATQAVPGPLFTFAAFLGASMQPGPGGWVGGLLCLVAVFVPGLLLVLGALPFWASLRRHAAAQAALAGVNAAVVGWLLAALFQPVWAAAVQGPRDVSVVLLALLALTVWKAPPWAVVLACGLVGVALPLR
jgi:chromate transporter